MTDQVQAPRRSRRAIAAQVAAIVGIDICIAAIVVVWLGRGALSGALDGLANDIDRSFDRAIAAADTVAGRLDDAASSIDGIATDSDDLASTQQPSRERLAGLQARLTGLADRYRELRVRFGEVRENVESARSTLRVIARIVPGERVPEGASDAVAAVDEKLSAIDDALSSTVDSVGEGTAPDAIAEAVSERAQKLQTAVAGAAESVDGLSARLTGASADANQAIGGIQTILTIAVLAISLLLVWVLLLNVALWLLGRSWRRDAAAAGAAAPGSHVDSSSGSTSS